MTEPGIDLSMPHRVHIVGVGGVGDERHRHRARRHGSRRVSGCDLKDSASAGAACDAQGVHVHVGHGPDRIGDADIVAVSTAIPDTQPRGGRGHASAASPSCAGPRSWRPSPPTRRCIAVSGTHGKTTTSSMLALGAGRQAGLHPSFIVGGELNEIGGGAAWDDGDWFVVEADESDGTFVELPAEVAVVTNVEADHLDYYGTIAGIEAAFDRFVAQAPGPNLVCADEPTPLALAAAPRRPHLRHAPGRRYPHGRPSSAGRDGVRFELCGRGAAAGRGPAARPGRAQRPQRHRRHRRGHRSWASRSMRPRPRSAATRALPAASSTAARSAA